MSSGMEREKLEKTISIEEEGNGRNESEPMTIPSSSHNQESIKDKGPSSNLPTVEDSPDGGATPKRQRTAAASSPGLPPLLVSASPPGFVTLEEIMKAANSVSNMALAHEIAVNDDFALEKVEPPNNSVHKKIKEFAHQAFWDVLKEELEQDPPNYSRALLLLEEIREWLLSLLLPHQTRTQQEIKDKLDLDLIRQQIEAGTLDMHSYSHYVVSLMARLCSPARDEKIKELTELRDLVQLYRGIFETLELMKIDMANFTIRMSRPHIAAHSVEYERGKFEDYLKITPDGLKNTRLWLFRNSQNKTQAANDASMTSPGNGSSTSLPRTISSILVESFMELVGTWDPDRPWPETVAMDEQRFAELRNKLTSVELVSSVILAALNCLPPGPLHTSPEFRSIFKEQIAAIVGSASSVDEIEKLLPNVAEQCIVCISKAMQDQGQKPMTMEVNQLINSQILNLGRSENRIRQILRSRLLDFLRQVISNEVARPTQIPSGLSLFKTEIAGIAGRFARLVSHNRAVFSNHYADLIEKHIIA